MKQRRQSLNESPTPQDTRGNESLTDKLDQRTSGETTEAITTTTKMVGVYPRAYPPPSSKSPVETPLNEHPERFLDRSGCSVES